MALSGLGDLHHWIWLLTIAETGLWFFNQSTDTSAPTLEAKAKAEKVPLKQYAEMAWYCIRG